MFTFFASIVFTCILLACGVALSIALHTRHTFKRSMRSWKRSWLRGAIYASPFLDDALFIRKDKYRSFWASEVEYDESYYL